MRSVAHVLALVLAVMLLAGCGTKGPLSLPPPDNDDAPRRSTR